MINKTFTLAMGVIGWAGLHSVAVAQTVSIPAADFAAFIGTTTNAGAASGGANTIVTASVGSGYVLGTTVDVLSANITDVAAGSWQNEPSIRLENDAFPGLSTYFNFIDGNLTYTSFAITSLTTRSLGASTTWAWGSAPTLTTGSAIPASSTWTIECYEGYDDDNAGNDSQGTGISFTLPGTPPPPPLATINIAGPVNFGGPVGDVDNSVVTGLSPLAAAGYIGTGVVVQSCDLTSVIAGTYESEARISLKNSAFPTNAYTFQFSTVAAVYGLVSIGPNVSRNWITNGGIGGILPAGSTWDVECFESFNDGAGVDSTGSNIAFDIKAGTPPPPPGPGDNPGVAIDLGTVTATNPLSATGIGVNAGAAKWYKFTVADVDGNLGDWLSIWTATTTADTEIGMYDSTGNLISDDDDDNANGLLSYILIGLAPGDPGGPGYDGVTPDPFQTAAGTYYLAVSTFNSVFSGGFGFTSTGAAGAGIDLNITTSVGSGGGGQFLTGNLHLNDTLFASGETRSISYTITTGLNTINGTITANASTMPLNLNLGSESGTAVIRFSGGSFLTKQVSVNLTGSSQNIGTVNMNNGDADDSGEVDAADIDNVIANFGQVWPGGVGNPLADLDLSGEVDAADIDNVIANFGNFDD
ncbi:MAG: hypothetical protein JNK63_08630 [Chthonomonas sp.]|nr:hypothetical protein [Chthonomonas sp.]